MGGLDIDKQDESDFDESLFFAKLDEELPTMKLNRSTWNIGKLGTAFKNWPELCDVDYKKDVTFLYRFSKNGTKRWASTLFVHSIVSQRKLTSKEDWGFVRYSFVAGRESIDWSLIDACNNMSIYNVAPIIPWSLWLKHLASKRMKS